MLDILGFDLGRPSDPLTSMFNTIQLNYRLHTFATTFRGDKHNMIEGVE